MSSMSVLVPITDSSPPSPLCPLPPDSSFTSLRTTQAPSHEQPVDLPIGSNHLRSAFIEEVDDEDLPGLSTHPQLIGHATIQHFDDPILINIPGPTSPQVPSPIDDPHEDLGASNSDN